jgi:choline dehydrogenase-like flavoprotein
MILDLQDMNESPAIECDLCLVGSGAAGLAIASEMASVQCKTVIIESGGLNPEPPTQALYDVDISGLPHPGSTQGRFRICGGSTTQWGGQALPLMPIDFERRDWVSDSGWPISFDGLLPYYARASQFLMIDNLNFDSDLFALLQTSPPPFDDSLWYHFSKWSPKPSVREQFLPILRNSNHSTLLLHANVTGICLGKNLDGVDSVEVRTLGGRKTTVRARTFVLCVGGIETARILLANNRQHRNGIGNGNDLVGRYFQDHPSAMVGWLKTFNPQRAQQLLNVFHKNGLKYSVRCTATPAWQRKHRTLNASMGTTFVESNHALQDAKDVYSAVRRGQIDTIVVRKLLRATCHPGAILLPVWQFLAHGRSYAPGASMRIGITSEQEPNPESRVLLSEKTDSLGTHRSNVRWRLTDLTRYTIRQYSLLLREEFARAGIGRIELDEWVLDDGQTWTDHVTDQFHHMGTARMHDSPRMGVVDSHCRVHGVSNLYIASSAVFPTSGHSNPTLTIIALCMRLADRLKSELSGP